MTLDEVQALLAERAYRPGWSITAYMGDHPAQIMVHIHATVEDSWHPGMGTPLDIRSPVPDPALLNGLQFDLWLAWRLGQAELHESMEWFRRPGQSHPWVPVFNPHSDGADRALWPVTRIPRPPAVPYEEPWRS